MKRLSIPLRVMFTLLVIAMLAACAPGEPAPSPEEIKATINTAVAQTMEAEEKIAISVEMTVAAQEAEAEAAEPLPTATLVPATALPTLTPILITATPAELAALTQASSSGGGGGGSGTAKYSCDPDLGKRPFDNSEFRPKDTFDIKFTIMNTGTATWPAGYDLVYHSGPHMAPAFPAFIELPEMKPGDTFPVGPYDAFAPDEDGFHVMTFKLEGGFCYPYVAINVK